MKKIYTTIIILVSCFQLQAQEITLYNLRTLPQSMELNPAFQIPNTFYFNLPVVSSLNVSVENSGFVLNDYKTHEYVNDFIDVLDDKNTARIAFSTNVLDFGFRVSSKTFISFTVGVKNEMEFNYAKGFLKILEGNAYNNEPKTIDFSENTGFKTNSYADVALGFSRKLNDNLTIGTRLHYLMGLASANFDFTKAKISGADAYQMMVEFEGKGQINGLPVSFQGDSLSNFKTNSEDFKFVPFKNNGFAVDFGFVYDNFLIKDLQISASVADLGLINWAPDNSSDFTLSTNYTFNGVDPNSAIGNSSGNSDLFEDAINEIKDNSLVKTTKNTTSRTSYLIPKINLGANYSLFSWLEANALIRSLYYGETFNNQFAFGGTIKTMLLDVTVNYAYMSKSFANIGAGVNLKLGAINIYAVSDNVLAPINVEKSKTFGVRCGVNFVFGNTKKRTIVDPEKKGIENYENTSDSTKSKKEKDQDFEKKKKEIDEKMENKKKELEKIDKEEGKKEEAESKDF